MVVGEVNRRTLRRRRGAKTGESGEEGGRAWAGLFDEAEEGEVEGEEVQG